MIVGRLAALALWLAGPAGPGLTVDRVESRHGWLDWSSPAPEFGCGDASQFASKVERRLGRQPAAVAEELGLSIAVHIERLSGPTPGWTGELRVRAGSGTEEGARSIGRAGSSCEPLTDTLALMVSLVLTGEPTKADPRADSSVRSQVRPAVQAVPQAADVAGTDGAQKRRWAIVIAGGPDVGVGLLPGLGVGGEVSLAVRRGGDGAGVMVSTSLWPSTRSVVNGSQGATLSLVSAELAACSADLNRKSRALGFCLGVEFARLRAEGFGFDLSTTEESWSIDLGAGVDFRQKLVGPMFVALGVKLLIPLERARIAYSDATGQVEQIFVAAPVAGSGQLRLGLSFQ